LNVYNRADETDDSDYEASEGVNEQAAACIPEMEVFCSDEARG